MTFPAPIFSARSADLSLQKSCASPRKVYSKRQIYLSFAIIIALMRSFVHKIFLKTRLKVFDNENHVGNSTHFIGHGSCVRCKSKIRADLGIGHVFLNKKRLSHFATVHFSETSGVRTPDTQIKSLVLYQLS